MGKQAGKNDYLKQEKMDHLEAQGVLIDPYKHDIPIKLISPSFIQTKARAMHKNIEDCSMDEVRRMWFTTSISNLDHTF